MSSNPAAGASQGSPENDSDSESTVSKSDTTVFKSDTPAPLRVERVTGPLPERHLRTRNSVQVLPPQYSAKYPPRGQRVTGRPAGRIEIEDNRGDMQISIRDLAYRAYAGPDALQLRHPLTWSELSGLPAYTVRLQYVELALNAHEICRLVLYRLTPGEFFALARKYGVFYEISSKFYDEETGKAHDTGSLFAEENYDEIEESMAHVVVVENNYKLTPHSVSTHARAVEMVEGFSESYRLKAFAVPLLPPAERSELQPFANIVALHVHEDNELRAYGPFPTEMQALAFIPANGHECPIRDIRVASVESSYFPL